MSEITEEKKSKVVHVYDGIEEEDNDLPRWWLTTLYGAIIFAFFYWLAFHTFEIFDLPMQAYGKEVAARAAEGGEITEELLEAMALVDAELGAGAQVYNTHCVVCHGAQGEGSIGPNLTDAYWIHGGDAMSIFETVRDGVPSAGMPNWGAPLGTVAVRQVTAYLLTLRGKNVPGKEPQGEPYTP